MLLDIIVIAAIIVYGASGYSRGFVNSAVALVKISVSVIIAVILSKPLALTLDKSLSLSKTCAIVFETNTANGKLILVAITALLIFIGIRLMLRLINKLATDAKENRIINSADSWLGFAFGVMRFFFAFCIISAVVYIITSIPFLDGTKEWLFKDSKVALWLYETATDLLFTKVLAAIVNTVHL